jgi:hypothetical protein
MHSRRWRSSGSVGPPDPGRGCPELVKPVLLTDIGVCMLQHRGSRAAGRCLAGPTAVGPAARRAGAGALRARRALVRAAGPARAALEDRYRVPDDHHASWERQIMLG